MTDQAQLLPGTLDLLILRAVSLGPLHGYGILLRIGQISANALLIEQGIQPPTYSARAVYRSRADFAGRGRSRTIGQRRAVARAELVESIPQMANPFVGDPGCECLWSRSAAGSSEWVSIWRGARAARTLDESVSDRQGGIKRQSWAAYY